MTLQTPTAAGSGWDIGNQTVWASSPDAEMDAGTVYDVATTPAELMPRTRLLMHWFGGLAALAAIAAAASRIVGDVDLFVMSGVVTAGLASLFSTMALRYYSRGAL